MLVPVVVLSLAGATLVPESRDSRRQPIDLAGALLVTSGTLAVVYVIIQGGEAGWGSLEIVGSLTAGAALLVAFGLVELQSSAPMMPLQYFKRMDFTGSFLVLMLLFVGMIGVFFFLTQFLQLVQGRSALVAGLAITPVAAAMLAGAVIATKAVPRFGPKNMIVVATLIIMAGMAIFSQIAIGTPYWVPILGIMIFGLGAGIAMPTVTDTIMASVPVNDAGIGSAMNDLSRELGITLGVAVLGSLVTSLYRADVRDSLEGVASPDVVETVGDSVGVVERLTTELPASVAAVVENVAYQSFVDALSIGYVAAAGFIAVALGVAAALIPNQMRLAQAEFVTADESDVKAPFAPQAVPAPVPVE